MKCKRCGGPIKSSYGYCQRSPGCKVAYQLAWREGNPERYAEIQERYEASEDRIEARQRNDTARYAANRDRMCAEARAYRSTHIEQVRKNDVLKKARQRARVKGVPFTITLKDLPPIPERCPALDIPLEFGKGIPTDASPSLDRIDPSKGYVPGNLQWLSKKANSMKYNASADELRKFAEWVLSQV